jgi:hypothetical protein
LAGPPVQRFHGERTMGSVQAPAFHRRYSQSTPCP